MEKAQLNPQESPRTGGQWDHSCDDRFFDYYAQESVTEATVQRFKQIRALILRVLGPERAGQMLDVADVGCGAGSQCFLWAELGHRVHGLDINERLVELARRRAEETGSADRAEFSIGSAASLPWADGSMDVCISPELLEHVPNWRPCLDEMVRVLRPGGLLFLTTTNKLCPKQQEFDLPLYSWYPGFLKRRYERLATTTRPELAQYATYPAVNWFTFFGLRDILKPQGFDCYDRFDTIDTNGSRVKELLQSTIRAAPPLRFLAHVATPWTQIVAIKRP